IAPQTTHSRLASDGPTLPASRHWTEETRSFSTLDDLRTKSCPSHCGLRLLHRGDRFFSFCSFDPSPLFAALFSIIYPPGFPNLPPYLSLFYFFLHFFSTFISSFC